MMRLILVEPPLNEPLTAAEAKARSNIGDEVSDEIVDVFIKTARQRIDGADGYLGRALITQTWMAMLDQFPVCDGGRIDIPLPPLQEIAEISYLDADGVPTVIAEGDYHVVMDQFPYVVPSHGLSWPTVATRADAISIVFVAGYGDDGDDVPEPIRTAISLQVGNLQSVTARSLNISEEVVEGVGSTRYTVSDNAGKVIDDAMKNLLSTYQVPWV